jgi:hypothetical protein
VAEIKIELLADISSAVNGIKKFSQETAKSTKGLESAFAKVNTAFLNVSNVINIASAGFATLRGVTSGAVDAFKKVINEAAAFEESVNKIRIALNLSGIQGEEAVKRFVDFAGALQATTRFGDDAILSAGALIQSLGGLTQGGLERATKAALDLSTALGIDLQSAATLVGKAAAGEVGAFSRYGLSIRKAASDTETLENALTAIEGKFGGASEQAVKSYAGAIDQLQNNISDFTKNIGLGVIQNEEFVKQINLLSEAFVDLIPSAIKFGKVLGELIILTKDYLVFIGDLALKLASIATIIPRTIGKFTGLTDKLKSLVGFTESASESTKELNKDLGKLPKEGLKIKTSINNSELEKQTKELEQSLKEIENKYKTAGLNQVEIIEFTKQESLKKVTELEEARIKSTIGYTKLRNLIEAEANVKLLEETTKRNREITSSFGAFLGKLAVGVEKLAKGDFAAVTVGITNAAVQGAQGASKLVSAAAGAAANAILPGSGEAVQAIVDVLAQGPEKVRETVREFGKAIPEVITNIIDSLPVLIETLLSEVLPALIEKIPEIITRLIQNIPKIIEAFIKSIPKIIAAWIKAIPKLVGIFAIELGKAALGFTGQILKGAAEFVKTILKGAAKGVTGGITGGIKKIGGGLKKLNPFAEGGVVPQGFPNDTYPAALTSGEAVVPNNLVDRLDRFLSEPARSLSGKVSSGGGGDRPQNLTIVLQVGQEELARTLVSLDRQGFRMAV